MANTTNLNLTKLAGTEKLKTFPSPYNENMDAIDAAFGAAFGVSGAPNVDASINNLADGLAIIANGNTHVAITSGQFVYVRNHGSLSEGLYTATANIAANGTLSGSNLTANAKGGLNELSNNISEGIASVIEYKQVGSSQFDLNSLGNTSCVFWTSANRSNVLNKPADTAGLAITFNSGGRKTQIFNNTSNDFFIRYGFNDTWQSWVNFANRNVGTVTKLGSVANPTSTSDTKNIALSESKNNFRYICICVCYNDSGNACYGASTFPLAIFNLAAGSAAAHRIQFNNGSELKYWIDTDTNLKATLVNSTALPGNYVVVYGIK